MVAVKPDVLFSLGEYGTAAVPETLPFDRLQ
jgi:hypothetical protein